MARILVSGDVAIDCHITRHPGPRRDHLKWNDQCRADSCSRWGGAALLARVMADATARCGAGTVLSARLPRKVPASGARLLRSFSAWEKQEREIKPDDKKGGKDLVWRATEFLGVEPGGGVLPGLRLGGSADIVVLDDANLRKDVSPRGFCRSPAAWPACLRRDPRPRWVVWKLWRPELGQPLGRRLLGDIPAGLVMIMSVTGLREAGEFISKGISWERTAQELYQTTAEKFADILARSPSVRIVVTLGAAGAFMITGQPEGDGAVARLVCDPAFMEDDWEALRPGKILGQTACVTTGIVMAMARSPAAPDWVAGIRAGLAAGRSVMAGGFAPQKDGLDFPYGPAAEALAASLQTPGAEFVSTPVPDPRGELLAAVGQRGEFCPSAAGRWTVVQSKYGTSVHERAREVVLQGVSKSLPGVPVMTCGGLTTVDRQEIESFHNIRSLFLEYARSLPDQKDEPKPVSVAVFGPPGSGKSYGVKQIAKALPLGVKVEEMTFNLSQLSDPSQLAGAFHLIRDSRLKGRLPLVFWDEFDASLGGRRLGWLRYFLSPMQDGTFIDGEATHPVGPALFVFAGGTCPSFCDFNCLSEEDGYAEFRAAKGPDFVSRLRGYLDILGPNPRGGDPLADPTYVMRRAILLNSMLTRLRPDLKGPDGRLRINEGVLRAFLTVSEFKHGARSMESIVTSSALAGETRFEPFSLPQQDQLDLHAPAWEFMALVHYPSVLTPARVEQLAVAFHEGFCAALRGREYTYGPVSNDQLRISSQLVPWSRLPEGYRRSNRGAVQAIPDKLADVGHVMVPGTSSADRDLGSAAFEQLAEREHERWLREKIALGWRQAPPRETEPRYVRDDARKLHDAMLPWRAMTLEERAVRFPENPEAVGLEELPESQKEKDRDQVRALQAVLATLDYVLVPSAARERRDRA